MDRTERFYKIDRLLRSRRAVTRDAFLEELGVSAATFKRDLEYLRDRLQAPVVWDRSARGYRYDVSDAASFALPGLWFNASEVHALLTMEQLLENIQPGLLAPHVQPLLARVRRLLELGDEPSDGLQRRIRVLGVTRRPVSPAHFGVVSTAVLSRRRLHIVHYHRGRDETTEREVSPQRLVYYRDNWYLDAWCHLRSALRSFSVDSLRGARLLDARAREITATDLDAELGGGYGIFAGKATRLATLRFTPERARWVADERWHSRQRAHWDGEGRYVLEVPYADSRELLMDILRHGPEVEVLGPPELQQAATAALRGALAQYDPTR